MHAEIILEELHSFKEDYGFVEYFFEKQKIGLNYMTCPRQPAVFCDMIWELCDNKVFQYEKRCIAFMSKLPSGWRCTVRALQGWMVEVIRQLCDILFWCLAVWAPRGPSPPHLVIPCWNTWGQTSSDEELVAVDHKKNIRAMSHKERRERERRMVVNREVDEDWGKKKKKKALRTGWLRREKKTRAKDRIKASRARNKA